MGEAEAHTSPVGRTESLVHERGAVGTGTGADAVVARETGRHNRRVEGPDVERHNARTRNARVAAVDHNTRAGQCTFFKTLGQVSHVRRMLGNARTLEICHARSESCQAMGVERTRLETVGHAGGLALVKAVDARAALQEGGNLHAGRGDETARTLRPEQRLVPREANHVGPECRHIERDGAGGLRGVEHKERACLMGERRHASHVVHIARQVRGMSRHDEAHRAALRIGSKKRLVSIPIKRTVGAVRHDVHHASPLVARAEERPQR